MTGPVLTRFEDVQRPLSLFVRGLLGAQAFPGVHQAPSGVRRAFANEYGLFFPDSFSMFSGAQGRAVYFAAAAHLVAHLRFGSGRFARGSLRAIQVVLVSLFEDARVERRLIAELPGLAHSFASFHVARASEHVTFPTLCARISRALADPSYPDPQPIVEKARALFHDKGDVISAADCRQLGSLIGNDVGQSRLSFSEREYLVEPVYRDDHRLLWEERTDEQQPVHEHAQQLERARAKPAHEPSVATSQNGAPTSPTASEPAKRVAPAEGSPVIARYPEYDYQIRTSRPDFCTVREQPVIASDQRAVLAAQQRRLPLALARLAGSLKLETRRRRRRQRDGDSLDLDVAIEARLDVRAGHTPDERVYADIARRRQQLALLLLLDMSASTEARLPDGSLTLLELARDASLLLGDVLARVGDRFAIHGFSSNGRHEVEYHRFKDFEDPWQPAIEARLASLTPRLSTRMGAALRHASRALHEVPADRRLLLLLTDGEPADIDAPDPRYLLYDAQRAVGETRRRHVSVLAVSLDAQGAPYLQQIFGSGRYLVLPELTHLPRVLTDLYAGLHV